MPRESQAPTTSLKPIAKADFGYEQARHLLWRAGFGGTPEQIRTLADWGPEKAVDHLLNVEEIESYPDPKADEFEDGIMRPLSEEERRQLRLAQRNQDEDVLARFRLEQQRRQGQDREQIRAMQRWWLRRMIETPKPLEEKMTLFWHGHFATSYRTIENSYHLYLQNAMFRKHAVGDFGQLLFSIIRDPAMLKYLDNDESRKEHPNENLARELMELFSLGEGAYTERDIKDGARALTGYTFVFNDFVFREEWHDNGDKHILGRSGNLDGDGFVRAILERRACAEFICAKLYRYFVNELPEAPGGSGGTMGSGGSGGRDRVEPQRRAIVSVVQQLAGTFLQAKYQLKPVLRRLFLSEHFYDPANMQAQIKSPAQLIVGAVRSLGTPVRDLGILADAMDLMGQNLFFPPNVAGWAGGRAWINTSTLYVRQNIMNFLLTGKTPRGFDPLASLEKYDPTALLANLAQSNPGAEKDPARVVDYVLRFALGGEPSAARRETLVSFLNEHGGRITPDSLTGVLALITAMPEYQLC